MPEAKSAAAQSDERVAEIFARNNPRVLIIGAAGQIGTDLSQRMLKGLVRPENLIVADSGPGYEKLQRAPLPASVQKKSVDITQYGQVDALIKETQPDIVIDLAAVLSATMVKNPKLGFDINVEGPRHLINALHANRQDGKRAPILLVPSSIAAVPARPGQRDGAASQDGVYAQYVTNAYGGTKVEVEGLMGGRARWMGVAGIAPRFPVVASQTKTLGSGTTDYSVAIFRQALRGEHYDCPIDENKKLPIIAGEDVVRTITHTLAKALETPLEKMPTEMEHAYHYNVPGQSLTPKEMFDGMQSVLPDALKQKSGIQYKLDHRDGIASQWHAQAEGAAIKKDCGFELAHNSPEKFAIYMLQSFAQNPDMLMNEGDGLAKQEEIRRNCTTMLEHLQTKYGIEPPATGRAAA